jgi:hypothetical protein
MQPVVDHPSPLMKRLYDILIILTLSIMMIQFREVIEQSMLMRYYTFWQNNVWSTSSGWIQQFDESIEEEYANVDKYSPHDWMMYNERNDSGYNDGYNQGLLAGHYNGWVEAKEYYQRIFERELRDAKQQWQEDGMNNEYSEEVEEEYKESEVADEWSSSGQK